METNLSKYKEAFSGRYFMPCYIDTAFLDFSFVSKAHIVVKDKIKKIDKEIIYRRRNEIGIEDIQDDLTRLSRLRSDLTIIIGKLKNLSV